LIPTLQQVYASMSLIVFSTPSVVELYNDLKNLKPFNQNQDHGFLSLKREISLKNIYYNYPNSSRTALRDISINIPVKKTVGLVGDTGSGKTTTADIILGLLEPQKGTLEIDGKVITKQNMRAWRRSIGYVPQQIYLSDDTISANIAFGARPNDINQEDVEKASKIANLHEFIVNELPKQYQTTIGERGVRLSGGQRQRIGIARALYNNPSLLVLDEATNALDNQTEQDVMNEINKLSASITIIIIAHRLNTIKNCDIIFRLDKGKLVSQGTADDLFDNSKSLDQ
jgi:ABC-type bacteriocin/lantibiotic exporter with double-glycine peptidase domain